MAAILNAARSAEYPRDLVGYGGKPPFADWPASAPIAVQFVLNYGEGGDITRHWIALYPYAPATRDGS